jgi:hypothetical protein
VLGVATVSGQILTAEQLAERWQVPVAWIYSKCRLGELPKIPLPGKYVRFRLETVERFERGELGARVIEPGAGSATPSSASAPPSRTPPAHA